jgi:hypothetical protein
MAAIAQAARSEVVFAGAELTVVWLVAQACSARVMAREWVMAL